MGNNYQLSTLKRRALRLAAAAAPYRPSYGGIVGAIAFFCVSMLPSLLPRPWLLQGIVSGISMAVGYGIGVATAVFIRWLALEHEPSPHSKRIAWRMLAVLGTSLAVAYLYLGAAWQQEVRRLVGIPLLHERYMLRVAVLSLAIGISLVLIARGIRVITRRVDHALDRFLPRRLGNAIGGAMVALFLLWLISGVFGNFLITQANNAYRGRNSTTPAGITQPTSSLRAGGPESLIAWQSLGRQGRVFVSGGPSGAQLSMFNGQPAAEPIRVYAGLDSAPTPAERAALAVAELKRTGAFNRAVLVLATPTGTGWLEPRTVDAVEYMFNGNTAIVAQQYSYLPSWISFLVDKSNATDAGQALFEAVYETWSQLPQDSRPKLYAYGLSLGAFGGQTPYAGVNDLRLSIDGALFQGTPNDTRLWRTITDARDSGSPEWQPTYKQGKTVRFAATAADISQNTSEWSYPRILYTQHASDPVVWFNFDLLFSKPDWLSEPRGPDVSPTVRWYPIVTFLQVAVDQFFANSPSLGSGHRYYDTAAASWAAVANPPGWDEQKTRALQTILDTASYK